MTDRTISGFHSATPGAPRTYTFCGLHLASRRIIDFIPATGRSSIIDAYLCAMKAGYRVSGVCPRSTFWADVGTPNGYRDTHRRIVEAARLNQPGHRFMARGRTRMATSLRHSGVKLHGWVSLGRNSRAAGGSRICDSIIMNDVEISRDADLNRAIIADGCKVTGHVTGIAMRAIHTPNHNLLSALKTMRWSPDDTILIPLSARGSARTFTRMRRGRESAMLIEYGVERPENGLYVQNARFLRTIGVRVPQVLLDLPDRHVTVMEDVGDCSLDVRIAGQSDAQVERAYETAIQAVLHLHREGAKRIGRSGLTLCEPFSPELYRWERELFAVHFLKQRLHLSEQAIQRPIRDLERLASSLLKEPEVLIHRDLQSSNILFYRQVPVFIDFQGMRLGPALYDLASLLCDPYVSLPGHLRSRLLLFYQNRSGFPADTFLQRFWQAAVQRLIQALGAYARLSHNRETSAFGRHIRPALKILDQALKSSDNMDGVRSIVSHALTKGDDV
jgi:aminoglycoside/choline kinase family phosphotransferase